MKEEKEKAQRGWTHPGVLMQIDLKIQSSLDRQNKDKNMIKLISLLEKFDENIKELIQQVKMNERLEKYFVKSGSNSEEVEQGLVKLCKFVDELKQKMQTNKMQINNHVIQSAFTFFAEYISQRNISILSNLDKAIHILDLQSKANCCFQLLQGSLTLPFDITTLPKSYFPHVWKFIQFKICGDQQKVNDGFIYLRKILGITTSAVIRETQQTGAFTKVMVFGLSYLKYFIATQQSILKSLNFYRKPTIEMAQQIWNLPQNGLIRQCVKIVMKSIKTNTKIYIPYRNQIEELPQDICTYNSNAIQVRIIYDDIIQRVNSKEGKKMSCFAESQKQIDTIILHMHGGGFVALSSRSMQTYTRRWAAQLKVPVFSVDYRKPPSHRFPTAIYDCLTVYSFIVNHITKYFRIFPKKIILAGDSAGGNLACSLMGLILKSNLQIPYGIYLAYPACDLRRIFSPSRIFSFSDPLLNPPMLMLCLKEYLNNNNELQKNPMASPVLLSQQFVNGASGDERFPLKWPYTIIQVGAKDPLYDDSLRLMQRMRGSNAKCECQVYENLSHGFLNLDFAIPQCSKTIEDSINALRKLIEN